MAKYPACGKEVETPNKEWNLGENHVSSTNAAKKEGECLDGS
jgi:hypothetical protein